MQQRSDRLVGFAAVLKHAPGHADQVGDIRNVRLLAGLLRMRPANKA
jgi:hypothetical protein